MGPGRVVLIAGPSGAGKSTLLRGVMREAMGERARVVRSRLSAAQAERAAFDCLSGDASSRASTLASAGLAEPMLWARCAGDLSGGERARLLLAIAIHGARAGETVFIDELASNLDRVNAGSLCATLRRWARRSGVCIVCAGAHEDLERMLAPDRVFEACSGIDRGSRDDALARVRVERGSMEDYRALSHLHYRGGCPATVVRVLRAVREVPRWIEPSGGVLAGVLCVSLPALNSRWRERAWPGVFRSGDKRRDAAQVNALLRTISRVIVEPRSRGLGVATALVRAYLADPITPATEASAAIGAVCPFFEHAGMTPYALGHDLIDTRLRDALAHLGTRPEALVRRAIGPGSLLRRELITWGRRRKLLGPGVIDDEEVVRLTLLAACRLCSRPRAFAYTKGDFGDGRAQIQHTPPTTDGA